MKTFIICRYLRNFMLHKDPHCFQNDTLCQCNYQCRLMNDEVVPTHFPSTYGELLTIIKKSLDSPTTSDPDGINSVPDVRKGD